MRACCEERDTNASALGHASTIRDVSLPCNLGRVGMRLWRDGSTVQAASCCPASSRLRSGWQSATRVLVESKKVIPEILCTPQVCLAVLGCLLDMRGYAKTKFLIKPKNRSVEINSL